MTMRVLDLFSGIGGFSLGLERAGMKTVAFCEIDPACQQTLVTHWPTVPVHSDIETYDFKKGEADVITAGFPCQDISSAGKGAGLSGSRSGLFWEVMRAHRLVRPLYTILENVADLLHRGAGEVFGALAESGLHIEWDCVPAYAVGAPHQRDRIFIVAYPDGRELQNGRSSAIRRRGKGKGKGKGKGAGPVAYADGDGKQQPGWCFREIGGRPFYRGTGSGEWRTHWLDRLNAFRGMDDGVSRGLDEAQSLGNSLLPQIPELIGGAILAAEAGRAAA